MYDFVVVSVCDYIGNFICEDLTYFIKAVLNHLPAIMIFLGATPSRSHIVANNTHNVFVPIYDALTYK